MVVATCINILAIDWLVANLYAFVSFPRQADKRDRHKTMTKQNVIFIANAWGLQR